MMPAAKPATCATYAIPPACAVWLQTAGQVKATQGGSHATRNLASEDRRRHGVRDRRRAVLLAPAFYGTEATSQSRA